jgi:hypothetical protein
MLSRKKPDGWCRRCHRAAAWLPHERFERRAADISVDHPAVVENYRAAQAIAARDERGEANTEELRQAVVHYRVLFGEMLEVREAEQEVPSAKQMAVPA